MEWADIGKAVAKGAPILGAVLAGTPAGMVISGAGALIASALGVEATPEAIDAHIAANPEALAHLREVEIQHQTEIARIVLEREAQHLMAQTAEIQSNAADRDSARKMQIETHSRITPGLAVLVTLGYFGILSFMLSPLFKSSDNPILLVLVGGLAASWGAIVNFYFGSSSSSARKDAALLSKGSAS